MASNYWEEQMREFDSGATHDTTEGKLDYEGFLHPAVLQVYAEYMNKNRTQPDGQQRASDNWQLGIPKDAYMKSAWRHFHDWWSEHRGVQSREGLQAALCGLMFNAMGYMYEEIKETQTPQAR